MKKFLATVLSVIIVIACLPMTALAESENYGEVDINVESGSVTYFDDLALTIYETLQAMADEGTISASGQTFDLDKDGTTDLTADNYSYTDIDGGTSYSTEFSKAETKSITGQIEFTVSKTINSSRIAEGKSCVEKIIVIFEDLCTDGGKHNWVQGVQKATFGKGGCTYAKCSKCQKTEMGWPLLPVSASIAKASYVYDGKAKKPSVNISTYDGPLDKEYYKVEYLNNLNAGTASVKVTLLGDYMEGIKKFTFKISKAANTLKVKAKKPSVKYSKLKKKNQTIALKSWVTVSKAQGKVTYKKSSGNKKITVSKAGKITVKKGLKKGTYKVKIKVTAAGNANYNAKIKTVTVTIKVK